MEVEEAIQQLIANGLVIVANRLRSPSEGHIAIARAIEPIDNEIEIVRLVDAAMIVADDGRWKFTKWDYVPGPGPDDVDFEAQNLDEAVAIALNYYFGQPEIHQGWILPIHKHPEWSAGLLDIAIANATCVADSEWKDILAPYIQRRGQLHPHGTLPEIFACVFTAISHRDNPNLTLYLRRDLGEAFIVERKT